MRRFLLAAALSLMPALAAAEAPGDLAQEVAELKKQVAELARRTAPKIGAVNIVRVFDELEQKVDMNAELRQMEEKRDGRLRELASRIKDLEEKAKLLRPESDESRKTADLLEESKREFRSYRDASEDRLYDKLFDFTQSIYTKMRNEIQTFAAEGGYDIVLRIHEHEIAGFDEGLRPRLRYLELNRRIEARSVLYHQSAYDFTDAIIKRMNEKYLREKAEKRKEQPPAVPTKPGTKTPSTTTPGAKAPGTATPAPKPKTDAPEPGPDK